MRTDFKISVLAMIAGLLMAAPASAASINLGGNGGLLSGNGGSTNPVVTIDNNGLSDDGSSNTAARTNLFDGPDNTDSTAVVDFGGADGTDSNVLLDLFGDGSNSTAVAGLGGAGEGNNDLALDLFGNAGGPTGPGGANGTNGTNGSGGASGIGGAGAKTLGTVQIASIDTRTNMQCFSPNADQMAKLVNRHDYVESTFATWSGANQIKVVDVGLCDPAGASITGQGNIGRLQAYISDHPSLIDGLGKLGRAPADVVGVDKDGQTLIVYVM